MSPESKALWDSLYEWVSSGAPPRKKPSLDSEPGQTVVRLIELATADHRQARSDIVMKLDKFRVELGNSLDRDALISFLKEVSGIASDRL